MAVTEDEGEGSEEEMEDIVVELVAVAEDGEVGMEEEVAEIVPELVAVTEEEITGVRDAVNAEEFCTATSVTLSTACRGRPPLLPVKSLAVSGRSDKQLLESLNSPLVMVQDEL